MNKKNSHDFKYAKNRTLKKYARKKGLKGKRYNAYVYGSVSHAMKRKAAKRG